MQRGLFPSTPAVSSGCDLVSPLFSLSFLLERWGITWTLNASSIATAVHSTWNRSTAVPPQTCVSNSAISPSFPRARPNFLVSFSFSRAQDVSAIPFFKQIILWVSRQAVFSAWARILKKVFHYIHLWIIFQSVWCQSSFQFPSSASPSCFAPFLCLPSGDTVAFLSLPSSRPCIL